MNEAYLTGEPFEVRKAPGAAVLSGALNGESPLTIRAEKLPVDSRYARIMRVMEETQQRRPRMRRLGDDLGGVVYAAGNGTRDPGLDPQWRKSAALSRGAGDRHALPVAARHSGRGDRRNFAFSSPRHHHQKPRRAGTNRSCRTFVFDKTGTLTYGKPALTRTVCGEGFSESEVLSPRSQSRTILEHPLASHSRLSAPARLSPFASFARQRSAG